MFCICNAPAFERISGLVICMYVFSNLWELILKITPVGKSYTFVWMCFYILALNRSMYIYLIGNANVKAHPVYEF